MCSDGNHIYHAFAKTLNLTHKIINASAKEHIKEGAYHIQNVNAYDRQQTQKLDTSLPGVGTKYLESYLEWMRMLDRKSN